MRKIYDQLNIEERVMLQVRLEMGTKPGAIAVGLSRPASTIWCELRRNGWVRPKTQPGPGRPLMAGGNRVQVAHQHAYAGKTRPRVVKRLQLCHAPWRVMQGSDRLAAFWSYQASSAGTRPGSAWSDPGSCSRLPILSSLVDDSSEVN